MLQQQLPGSSQCHSKPLIRMSVRTAAQRSLPRAFLPNLLLGSFWQERLPQRQQHVAQVDARQSFLEQDARLESLHSSEEPLHVQPLHLTKAQREGLARWAFNAAASGAFHLPVFLGFALTMPAWAEAASPADTAQQAVDSAQQAAQTGGSSGPGLLLVFGPLVLYGLFYAWRQFVNPKAKLSDALFIAASGVVVGNIISIVFFRVRLY